MSPRTTSPRKTERLTLRLRPQQRDALQTLVDLGLVDSLSSALREAVNLYIQTKMPQAPTVKASTTNVDELGKLALEQLVKMQVQEALKKQRKELSRP